MVEQEHYGVAGGGCACGWVNPHPEVNWYRALHMYDHNPEFRELVEEQGWPRG